jgi:hypothetical protein
VWRGGGEGAEEEGERDGCCVCGEGAPIKWCRINEPMLVYACVCVHVCVFACVCVCVCVCVCTVQWNSYAVTKDIWKRKEKCPCWLAPECQ